MGETSEFRLIRCTNPRDEGYEVFALARVGDYMDMPQDPPGDTQSSYFSGWANEINSQRWNFAKDKVEADMVDNFELYALWDNRGLHNHDNVEYRPWVFNDRLPDSGYYYLVDDVILPKTHVANSEVHICLNGKTISTSGNDKRAFDVVDGADVSIWDENDEGTITGNTSNQYFYDGGTIQVTGGKFTLDGGKIKDGQGYRLGGNVYMTGGEFVMNGGEITDGVTENGGAGVYVSGEGAKFTMNGGTIKNNQRRRSQNPCHGGGIGIYNGAIFHMTGGTISNNLAQIGSAVYVHDATMTISGGTITGNNSEDKGAVCIHEDSTLTLVPGSDGVHTDTITIKGNTNGDVFDVHTGLAEQPFITVDALISEDSEIGVLKTVKPKQQSQYYTVPGKLQITTDLTTSGNTNADAFFSSESLAILYRDDEAWLTNAWDIKYEPGDHGTGDMSDKNAVVYDEDSYTVEQNAFTPEDSYEFDGWKAGNDTYEEGETIDSVEENYTFVAQWKEVETTTYTIEYDLAGGTLPEGKTNPETYTERTTTFTLNNPVKEGYVFSGWTGTDLETPTVEVTIPKGSTGDRSYQANWRLNQYTVVFNANGGEGEMANQTREYNDGLELSANSFARSNYIFTGWNTQEDGSGTSYVDKATGNLSDEDNVEVLLYAQWDALNHVAENAPTCFEPGNIEYWTYGEGENIEYFSDDKAQNKITEAETILEATGHIPAESVIENEVFATCTEGGSRDRVTYCSQCNEELKRVQETTSPLGHAWDEGVVTTEPTCTEKGIKTYTCQHDGSHTREEEIEALGHIWSEWTVTKEATETEEGEESRVCAHNAEHVETRTIPTIAHVHGLEYVAAKEASCQEEGNIEYWVCLEGDHPCGRLYLDEAGENEINAEEIIIAKPEHTWDEGVVTVEPKCTTEGEKVLTCNDCGETKIEPIEILGHTTDHKDEVISEATCTKSGYHNDVVYCTRCEEIMTTRLVKDDALGHDWGEWTQILAPTCTTEGEEEHVCSRDETHKESRSIPIDSNAHKWGEWVVIKEPTTKETGLKEHTCELNAEHTETEEIPAKEATIYKITYKLDGGQLDGKTGQVVKEVEEGETITLPKPTRTGYNFDYWEGSRYDAGDPYVVKADHTFTAKWKAIAVTSVKLNKSSTTLQLGKTETLVATVSPTNALNKNVTWTSSNNNVAKVDSNGKVTAVNGGTATITVTTQDGKKTAKATVTVNMPKVQAVAIYNSAHGADIRWKPINGVRYYGIWRKRTNPVTKAVEEKIVQIIDTNSYNTKEGSNYKWIDPYLKDKYTDKGKEWEGGWVYYVTARSTSNTNPSYNDGKHLTIDGPISNKLNLYRLRNPDIKTVTADGNGKVTVTWNNVPTAFGYEVQYTLDSGKTWTKVPEVIAAYWGPDGREVKVPGYKPTVTISNLPKGKKVNFRIRCRKTNTNLGDTWSEYSPWRSTTVK